MPIKLIAAGGPHFDKIAIMSCACLNLVEEAHFYIIYILLESISVRSVMNSRRFYQIA